MSTTTRTAPVKTPIRTPRRFVRCIACSTIKKERSYSLCSECYRQNGLLSPAWFGCWIRHTEREETQYSYRNDPRFARACRIYARRRRRAEAQAAIDAALPQLRRRATDLRTRYAPEEYDGLGPYDLQDLLDAQQTGVELPKPDRSVHRELSDAEIARWDARVDAWAAAHGRTLADEPAPEIRPWGYAMEIEGATVWTDDLVLN